MSTLSVISAVEPRKELLRRMKTQPADVPSLSPIFKNWPRSVNINLNNTRASLRQIIERISASETKARHLERMDLGLFSSTWWPSANLDAGVVLSQLVLWLFIWDDEIDAEVGQLSCSFDDAQAFRRHTVEYIEYCLGLTAIHVPTPQNRILSFFKAIGDAACQAYDRDHREILFAEFKFFIEASEMEQRRRLSHELPSVEEYRATRMGTSAVNVTTFFNEYACGITLPAAVLRDPQMRTIWDKTNIIIWAVNDIVSLKKEVSQNCIDSLVPLLYEGLGDVDSAVQRVVQEIQEAVRDFDEVATRLLSKYAADAVLHKELERYLDACRENCTGNLLWSLQTGRYNIGQ